MGIEQRSSAVSQKGDSEYFLSAPVKYWEVKIVRTLRE